MNLRKVVNLELT